MRIERFNIKTLPIISNLRIGALKYENTIAMKKDGLYLFMFNRQKLIKISEQLFEVEKLIAVSTEGLIKLIEILKALDKNEWTIEIEDTINIKSGTFNANIFHGGSDVVLYPTDDIKTSPIELTLNQEDIKDLIKIFVKNHYYYFSDNEIFTVDKNCKSSVPIDTKNINTIRIESDQFLELLKSSEKIDFRIIENRIHANGFFLNSDSWNDTSLKELNYIGKEYFKINNIRELKKVLTNYKDDALDIKISSSNLIISSDTIYGSFYYAVDIETNINKFQYSTNKKNFIKLLTCEKISIEEGFLIGVLNNIKYQVKLEEFDTTREKHLLQAKLNRIAKEQINLLYEKMIQRSFEKQLPYITNVIDLKNAFTGYTVGVVNIRGKIEFLLRDTYRVLERADKIQLFSSIQSCKEYIKELTEQCDTFSNREYPIEYHLFKIENNAIVQDTIFINNYQFDNDYKLLNLLQSCLEWHSRKIKPISDKETLRRLFSKNKNRTKDYYFNFSYFKELTQNYTIEQVQKGIEKYCSYDINEVYKRDTKTLYSNNTYHYNIFYPMVELIYFEKMLPKGATQKEEINTHYDEKLKKETTMSTKLETQQEAVLYVFKKFNPKLEDMQSLINTVSQYEYENRLETLENDLKKTAFKGLKKAEYSLLVNFTEREYLESLYRESYTVNDVSTAIEEIKEIAKQSENIVIASVPPVVEIQEIDSSQAEPNWYVNPDKYIIRYYTDKARTKVFAPEIYTIEELNGDYAVVKGANASYTYNIKNKGIIKFHGKNKKGSASVFFTLKEKPTIEEANNLSKQFRDLL